MKTAALALASAGVAAASVNAPLREVQYQQLFKKFITDFNKQYEVSEIFDKYNTFKANHKFITEENSKGHSYTLAVNEFADMTTEEFGAKMTGLVMPPPGMDRREQVIDPNFKFESGDSIDWVAKGAVTPVKNQGQCGSCWAFSTVAACEGQNFITNGKLVSLSEQELVDCAGSSGNQGCNGGLMDNAFKWIEGNGGLCTEADYPYKGTGGSCQDKNCQKQAVVTGYTDVKKGDEDALMQQLQSGPVSVAIEADQSGFQFYSGGVFSGSCGKQLDHGVTLVAAGTDNGKDYWTIKNSWGASWGEQGYIRFIRGQDQCGLADAASQPQVQQVKPTPPPAPTPPPPPTVPPTPSPRHPGDCYAQTTADACNATEENGTDCNWCDYGFFQQCQTEACPGN